MDASRLDPLLQELRRERMRATRTPLYELPVAEARAATRADSDVLAEAPEPVDRIVERTAPGPSGPIHVRLYAPDAPAPQPFIVYFFGGGWVVGSIDNTDTVYRRLANAVPCAVAAVEYRQAPEHPFPAAVEDCYAATCWLAEHAEELGLDASRIGVGGASAGGNLAAVVSQLVRDRGGPRFSLQLLVYPVTDYSARSGSMVECNDPSFFDAPTMAWFWQHYLLDPAAGSEPLASPIRARDLGGLAPALVVTAEFDPLRDQGELYAERLAEAGVPVTLTRYDGVVHGFFTMSRLDASRAALEQAATALRQAFSRSRPSTAPPAHVSKACSQRRPG